MNLGISWRDFKTGRASENNQIKAGKEFFKRLDDYFLRKQTVIIESTLSGLGFVKQMQKFKDHGYSIHIIYVFLHGIELCIYP